MSTTAVPWSSRNQQLFDPAWSSPENVSSSSGRATNPVLLTGADDVVHLLWEENDRIYHALRRAGLWEAPRSIATGQRPAGSLAPDGTLHVVYSNEFSNRYNIFYVAWDHGVWTLPRLVSKTPGASLFPSLAVDRAGVVHAAWADNSPGFSVIYHGWLQGTWLNEPLSNARGSAPVMTLDGAVDELHVAYQGTGINSSARDVFHIQGQGYVWSLPENISTSSDNESLGVAMACAPDGSTHLAWQEQVGNKAHIRYVSGQQNSWTAPLVLSDAAVDAREPALLLSQGHQLSLAWREMDVITYRRRELTGAEWTAAKELVSNPMGLSGPVMATSANGRLNLAWSGWAGSSDRDIFYSEHGPLFGPKVFLPGVKVGGR